MIDARMPARTAFCALTDSRVDLTSASAGTPRSLIPPVQHVADGDTGTAISANNTGGDSCA